MNVLIFGPSGSGKTYMANAWKQRGIPAFEDCDIEGLANWYDSSKNKVAAPRTAHEALSNHYSFLWSKRVLKRFLASHFDVVLLGGSGNVFDVVDLFDKAYFLKIEPQVQKERILHLHRTTPLMDFDENGIVLWGQWLEEEARRRGIPFLDASRSPDELFEVIRGQRLL